ncbi:uncharacterized protein M421DRAFT_399319 [Didymella exigua CBS 183.55]|uniref:Uncharacterized protein n=1 Tax=Didymella exigua CBS 183.55 TaxID=1150837 RepID=A0A6A5S341_9PLEO|nr:uncharacterized protein M421DRAFT_399319 [Didymella exigua CBS 183.55]KAF1932896.1 hypothetical protein M421DRAFT_399319 [Didymella exigua CBS 183.55]
MVRSWWVRWSTMQCDGRRGERGGTTRLSLDADRRGAMSQQHRLTPCWSPAVLTVTTPLVMQYHDAIIKAMVETAHSNGAASTVLDKVLIVKIADGGCSRGSIEGGERYTHGARPSSPSASQALQARPRKRMGPDNSDRGAPHRPPRAAEPCKGSPPDSCSIAQREGAVWQ